MNGCRMISDDGKMEKKKKSIFNCIESKWW